MNKNFILSLLFVFAQGAVCQAEPFGVILTAAPVLNSPDFSSVFGIRNGYSMKTDRCGQVRELEYIALPGAVFNILREFKHGTNTVYQVETEDYPPPTGIRLYLDKRFIDLRQETPPSRKRFLPTRENILETLAKSVGSPYVWGGNILNGLPELLNYFYSNIKKPEQQGLTLAGLDCSGLLYQATDGWTPRNTSQLVSFGQPIEVAGKNVTEIARLLEPLDLIVWSGHLLIVMNKQLIIESRLECGKPGNGGVVTAPLTQRLQEIMQTRQPANNWPNGDKHPHVFVVRRWL